MFTPQKRSANTRSLWWVLVVSFGSGSNAAINYKKSLTLTAVYNAVEQISNDTKRFPLTKKTATTANQNPIIQHTSLFLFRLTA
jgi:ribosomal protein S7